MRAADVCRRLLSRQSVASRGTHVHDSGNDFLGASSDTVHRLIAAQYHTGRSRSGVAVRPDPPDPAHSSDAGPLHSSGSAKWTPGSVVPPAAFPGRHARRPSQEALDGTREDPPNTLPNSRRVADGSAAPQHRTLREGQGDGDWRGKVLPFRRPESAAHEPGSHRGGGSKGESGEGVLPLRKAGDATVGHDTARDGGREGEWARRLLPPRGRVPGPGRGLRPQRGVPHMRGHAPPHAAAGQLPRSIIPFTGVLGSPGSQEAQTASPQGARQSKDTIQDVQSITLGAGGLGDSGSPSSSRAPEGAAGKDPLTGKPERGSGVLENPPQGLKEPKDDPQVELRRRLGVIENPPGRLSERDVRNSNHGPQVEPFEVHWPLHETAGFQPGRTPGSADRGGAQIPGGGPVRGGGWRQPLSDKTITMMLLDNMEVGPKRHGDIDLKWGLPRRPRPGGGGVPYGVQKWDGRRLRGQEGRQGQGGGEIVQGDARNLTGQEQRQGQGPGEIVQRDSRVLTGQDRRQGQGPGGTLARDPGFFSMVEEEAGAGWLAETPEGLQGEAVALDPTEPRAGVLLVRNKEERMQPPAEGLDYTGPRAGVPLVRNVEERIQHPAEGLNPTGPRAGVPLVSHHVERIQEPGGIESLLQSVREHPDTHIPNHLLRLFSIVINRSIMRLMGSAIQAMVAPQTRAAEDIVQLWNSMCAQLLQLFKDQPSPRIISAINVTTCWQRMALVGQRALSLSHISMGQLMMGSEPQALVAYLLHLTDKRLRFQDRRGLTTTLHGWGVLEVKPGYDMVEALAECLLGQLPASGQDKASPPLNGADMSAAFWGCALLGVDPLHGRLLEAMGEELLHDQSAFEDREEIATTLLACADLRKSPCSGAMIQRLAQILLDKPSYTPEVIAKLLHAVSKLALAGLVRLNEGDEVFCKLIASVLESTAVGLNSLNRYELFMVILSLGSLCYHPGNKWLANYVDLVLAAGLDPKTPNAAVMKKTLDVSRVAALINSLARFQYHPGPAAMRTILDCAPELLQLDRPGLISTYAWGLAAFGELEPSLAKQLFDRFRDEDVEQMHYVTKHCLFHTYLMLQASYPAESEGIMSPVLYQACQEAWTATKTTPSNLHATVATTITYMNLEHELECKSADGLFSIDIAVFLRGQEDGQVWKLAVEADGPGHFTSNKVDMEDGSPPRYLPLGRTVLRNRLLRHRGWLVVSVPSYDFNRCLTWESRAAYIKGLIETEARNNAQSLQADSSANESVA